MSDNELRPEPPEWALTAGLPGPLQGEGFSDYSKRIGIDPEPLLEGLNEVTLCLANLRLATALQREMPSYFNEHVKALVTKHRRPVAGVSLRPS